MEDGERRDGLVMGLRQERGLAPLLEEFDMTLIRPLARSVRLNGFATCMRLEQVYWNILGRMAENNSCSVGTLLSRVDREVHLRHGGVKNFSGLVRVVCVVHGLREASAAAGSCR